MRRTESALDLIRQKVVGTSFENSLYLVGGAVRDRLLHFPETADLDLVTTGDAVQLAGLLSPLSSIPPVTYPRFGTAMIKVSGIDIELVTARKESYDQTSRKPNVARATLQEDAYRRDFTVNALLQNIQTCEVLDPTGIGLDDLKAKRLRTPLDPVATFQDDPLRMLRAVRFRWKLGFEPGEGLYEAIRTSTERLKIVSMERVRDELIKMLLHSTAPDALDDLMQLGLMEVVAPELLPMIDCEQGKYHHLDVWRHTLLVLRNVGAGDLVLSLAALLHDVGKPPTRTVDPEGNTRFFGHEGLGKKMSQVILRRLKFPQREIDEVSRLVGNHMRLGSAPTFTPAAARRLLRDMDGDVERLLWLVQADVDGLKPGVKSMDVQAIRMRLAEVQKAVPVNLLQSPISGEEIMRLTGLSPGPQVGRIKHLLTEKVIEGEIAPGDREAALALVRSGLDIQ